MIMRYHFREMLFAVKLGHIEFAALKEQIKTQILAPNDLFTPQIFTVISMSNNYSKEISTHEPVVTKFEIILPKYFRPSIQMES
jgi:hypothetical protein